MGRGRLATNSVFVSLVSGSGYPRVPCVGKNNYQRQMEEQHLTTNTKYTNTQIHKIHNYQGQLEEQQFTTDTKHTYCWKKMMVKLVVCSQVKEIKVRFHILRCISETVSSFRSQCYRSENWITSNNHTGVNIRESWPWDAFRAAIGDEKAPPATLAPGNPSRKRIWLQLPP